MGHRWSILASSRRFTAGAGCLKALHQRVSRVVRDLGASYEIILVDDRGPDESWLVMAALAQADPEHVRAIRLSRNYGQHAAITAGLTESRGRAAIVMDCDLQDPPEDIVRLYASFLEGHQVVLTRRIHKKHHPFKKLTARIFAWLLTTFTNQEVRPEVGTFSLISRPVIDAFLRFKDVNRHYLYILGWLGFDPVYIDYEHAERAAGRTLTRSANWSGMRSRVSSSRPRNSCKRSSGWASSCSSPGWASAPGPSMSR